MKIDIVLICLAMTGATYFCRSALTVTVSKVRISRWWENYLAFIPFAVLTALVTPYLFLPGPAGKFSPANPYLLAGAVTFLISYRTRSLIWAVGIGMGVFWVLSSVIG